MNFSDAIKTFHGTSDKIAEELVNGRIDVSIGGGEMGQGFYLGDKLSGKRQKPVSLSILLPCHG